MSSTKYVARQKKSFTARRKFLTGISSQTIVKAFVETIAVKDRRIRNDRDDVWQKVLHSQL